MVIPSAGVEVRKEKREMNPYTNLEDEPDPIEEDASSEEKE